MTSSTQMDPWLTAQERYLETLTDEEKSLFTHTSLENVFYSASAAQKTHEEESRSRDLSKRLKPLLDAISDYGAALDVYSNASPSILCPLWGSIRVLLHIASEFNKYFEKIIDMLASIGDILPIFRVYQQLFAGHHFLVHALSEVYLDIIEFCASAKQIFDQLKGKRGPITIHLKVLWKPFDRQFGVVLDNFRRHKASVERQASLSHMIEASGERGAQSEERMQVQLQRSAENAMQKELKRIRVLKQISTIDHEYRHRQLRKKRYGDTGNWILDTKQFTGWIRNARSCSLWCYGIPGCGKTILTTTVVEALLNGSILKAPIVAYFYCDYSDQKTIDSSEILSSFIKQLLSRIEIPDHIQSTISAIYQSGLRKPDSDELLKLLFLALELFSEVFLILDGIDECRGSNRAELLAAVQSISQSDTLTTIVKFFIASRADIDLKRAFDHHIALPILINDTAADIVPFINGIVREKIKSRQLLIRDPSLEKKIINALVKGAQGMFIWVAFQIADICEETCDDGIKKALLNLPEDLAATYTRALRKAQNRKQSSSLAQKIFKWMVCARRPLSMDEIKEAISISPLDKNLDRDKITTDDSRVLEACANLAVLDSDEGTIRFVHYSVQEFLLSDLACSTTNIHFRFSDADHEVGEICITYLSFGAFETQISKQTAQAKIGPNLLASAFLPKGSWFGWLAKLIYNGPHLQSSKASPLASINWDEHLKFTKASPAHTLGQQFRLLNYVIDYWTSHVIGLSDSDTELWSKFKLLAFERNLGFTFRPWERFSTTEGLPYMSLVLWALQVGNAAFLALLLRPPKGPTLHHYLAQEIEGDRVPLLVVALRKSVEKGYAEVVRLLLRVKAEQGRKAGVFNLNPLLDVAVRDGHDTIVRLLLEGGADKNAREDFKNTPLHLAASRGYDAVAKALLDSGADMDAKDDSECTPLHLAASEGHAGVAKVLLDSGADKNARNASQNTPLHLAASGRHDAVAKVLLDSGADKNAKNGFENTPLHWAASGGHDTIVRLLLEGGADKNARNGPKNTPLHWAALRGHDAVIKVLLDSGADKNAKNGSENTPLDLAVQGGHSRVIEVLQYDRPIRI